MTDELMKLIHGEAMEPDLEEAAFEKIVTQKPRVLPQLCRHLFSERRQIRGELAKLTVAAEKAKAQGAKAKAALKAISQPPLHPGILLRACEGGKLDVAVRGGRQIVAVHPDLANAPLRSGDEVWLDPQTGVVVSHVAAGPRLGRVAPVAALERLAHFTRELVGRVGGTDPADERLGYDLPRHLGAHPYQVSVVRHEVEDLATKGFDA